MKFYKSGEDILPEALLKEAGNNSSASELCRREFLSLASVFGATTAMAYGMIGAARPVQAATPKSGGTLRVGQVLLAG